MDWLVCLTLFGSFFFLMALGLPISFAVGIASIAALLLSMDVLPALMTVPQKMVTGIDSFSLLAVPFFILAGNIMNRGGLALRLIRFAQILTGRLPGSLLHCNVIANMLFGSLSGSAVASAAAVGGIMAPLQKKEGYDPRLSTAVNVASAPVGLLIPPSNALIVYSLVSGGTPVAALFLAGYIPGILWGIALMTVAAWMSAQRGYIAASRPSYQMIWKCTLQALPALGLIVIVIGGILSGYFTPTESSAIAVVYCTALSFLYRELRWSDLPAVILESGIITGIVLLLIGVSMGMSYVMAFSGIPYLISDALLALSQNPIVILLIINLTLLVIGFFMDMTPAILIFTPIFFPIVTQELGIDPVHFGIMMVFNLCIGICTPPVGSALFIGCSVGGVSLDKVLKPLLPLFLSLLVTLLLIIFVPAISLWLPRQFNLL